MVRGPVLVTLDEAVMVAVEVTDDQVTAIAGAGAQIAAALNAIAVACPAAGRAIQGVTRSVVSVSTLLHAAESAGEISLRDMVKLQIAENKIMRIVQFEHICRDSHVIGELHNVVAAVQEITSQLSKYIPVNMPV